MKVARSVLRRGRASNRSFLFGGGPDKGDGMGQSAEEIIARMDGAGIDKAVVFPFNDINPGISFSSSNNWIQTAVTQPPDRLIGYARLDPNFGDEAMNEDCRCIHIGLSGIKLHPHAQKFPIDDPTVYKIAEYVANECHEKPILFDNVKPTSHNKLIMNLAGAFSDVTFVLAHMQGGDFIEVTATHENIFIQTTGVPQLQLSESEKQLIFSGTAKKVLKI